MKKKLPKVIRVEKEETGAHPKQQLVDFQPAEREGKVSSEEKAEIQVSSAYVHQAHGESATNGARRQKAMQLVERFAFWSGAAGAMPIPALDLVAVAAVQLQMIRRLADLYGVDFSPDLAKALLASVGGAMLAGSSGLGVASLTKGLPVIGPLVSYTAVPTLAAGATLATGLAFIEHFSIGGTLLDFRLGKASAFQSPPTA